LINSACLYYNVVIVLDGIDNIVDLPFTSAAGKGLSFASRRWHSRHLMSLPCTAGPRRAVGKEDIAKELMNRDPEAARANDPFYIAPPPLWWLPADLPQRLRLVLAVRTEGPVWLKLQELAWHRNALEVPTLSRAAVRLLLDAYFAEEVRQLCVCVLVGARVRVDGDSAVSASSGSCDYLLNPAAARYECSGSVAGV
jgi:hypothetical protein